MRFHRDGHEARRVDGYEYDGLCRLISWCGGKPVAPNEDLYVIEMPTPAGPVMVAHNDWIIRDETGVFHAYRQPDWRPIVDGWPWFLARANE